MAESPSSPGIHPPSPTLSARLRELAHYLAAPIAGRLTEEQRALSLGIARRLVADMAGRLDSAIDAGALWHDWLAGGLPGPERFAAACFARAEEHRWRGQSARYSDPPPILAAGPGEASDEGPAASAPLSDVDRAYLALQIADRRRFDMLGHPALAIADLRPELFRALLLDIAAWRLGQISKDQGLAAELGDAVRVALERQADGQGVDQAAAAYHDLLAERGALSETAATAIVRHDWPTLIALIAAAQRRPYDEMALALLTAETAALPSLLAPLRLDRAALAPLEQSLAMLPARAVSGGVGDDDARQPQEDGA